MKKLRKCLPFNEPKIGNFAPHVNPVVIFIWNEIIRQKVSLTSVAEATGIERAIFHRWRVWLNGPKYWQVEAALRVLGYKLKIVKIEEDKNES